MIRNIKKWGTAYLNNIFMSSKKNTEENSTPESNLSEEKKREMLDSKTSDLTKGGVVESLPKVKVPTVGRTVSYFPNGTDKAATSSDDKKLFFPAVVVALSKPDSSDLTLSVTTDGTGKNLKSDHVQLKKDVNHKSQLAEFGGPLTAVEDSAGIPYWDWPVIER
jgi:hypothetical protein